MVYSRYVYGCGPYRYMSKREGNSVHSIYLGKGGSGEVYTTYVGSGMGNIGDKTEKDLNIKTNTNKTEEYKMSEIEYAEKRMNEKISIPLKNEELSEGEKKTVKLLRDKYAYNDEKIAKVLKLNRESDYDKALEDKKWKGYGATHKPSKTNTQPHEYEDLQAQHEREQESF